MTAKLGLLANKLQATGDLPIATTTSLGGVIPDNSTITITAAGVISSSGGGTGGVTSVTATPPVSSTGGNTPVISLSANYGDTLNPYASKTAATFLAAPNAAAGVPAFRAIVAADIPVLNQNTSGTAAGLSQTLAVTSGGTGQITANAAINALLPSQTGFATRVLTTDGSNTSWAVASGSGASYTGNGIPAGSSAQIVLDFTFRSFSSTFTTAWSGSLVDSGGTARAISFSVLNMNWQTISTGISQFITAITGAANWTASGWSVASAGTIITLTRGVAGAAATASSLGNTSSQTFGPNSGAASANGVYTNGAAGGPAVPTAIVLGNGLSGSFTSPTLTLSTNAVYTLPTPAAGALTLDASATNSAYVTALSGTTTLTISNIATPLSANNLSVEITVVSAQTATSSFINNLTLTGATTTTLRWFGGSAPTAGGAAGTFDRYMFNIIRTAPNVYSVLARRDAH